MALISIPTSIGGVTIPGGLINGPLGSLFGNPFSSELLQYPRDLQSATRGHVVHFTIKEVRPVNYEDVKNVFVSVGNAASNFGDKIVSVAKGESTVSDAFGFDMGKLIESSGLNFQPRRDKIAGHIFMYMPDTVNFQYGVTYNTTDLVTVAGKALEKLLPKPKGVGKTPDAVTSMVDAGVSSGLLNLLGQKAGYAVNPQLQLLFNGIGFREYQMAFTFTPYSKQEAQTVDKIIKMFRTHAAPKIITGSGGMFFVPPSAFQIDFLLNGKKNPHLNKLMDCVITNVDVNYAPNGWSSHTDGSPVQTTLTISFKEISLVDRTKIEKEGY
jgi:hypothetical protein